MVAGWTKHAIYLCLTDGNNNLLGELYASWLSFGCHCQCNGNGQSCSGGDSEPGNNLFRAVSNTHCYSFCSWWNLRMVTGWTKHAKHYSESFINYNLLGELYTSWLSIGCHCQCNGNGQSCAGGIGEL